MLKQVASLEQKIDEWESQWILANETPLGVCRQFHEAHGRYLDAVEENYRLQQEKLNEEAQKAAAETVVEAEVVPLTSEA